jgi:hypothetical protein
MKVTYEPTKSQLEAALIAWMASKGRVIPEGAVFTFSTDGATIVTEDELFSDEPTVPLQGTATVPTVFLVPGAPAPVVTAEGPVVSPLFPAKIPLAPLSATGKATVFGRNYNDSDDTGDLNPDGSDSSGFFIDPATGKNYATHLDSCVGGSLPREVLLSTLLGVDDWRSNGIDSVWMTHAAAVQAAVTERGITMTVHDFVATKTAAEIPLVDAGPSAHTYALFDRTRGLCQLMGSKDDSHVAVWLQGADGVILPIRGWLFDKEKVG